MFVVLFLDKVKFDKNTNPNWFIEKLKDLVSIEAAVLKSCEGTSSSHPDRINIVPAFSHFVF